MLKDIGDIKGLNYSEPFDTKKFNTYRVVL